MFYQACRVSGKNSTPCVERKVDGTIVIEVDMDPSKDMNVTCDCVGILKERNVDVEHRFPQEAGVLQGRSKKKSTRCRMVFRTMITNDDGTTESLQVCSNPIVCSEWIIAFSFFKKKYTFIFVINTFKKSVFTKFSSSPDDIILLSASIEFSDSLTFWQLTKRHVAVLPSTFLKSTLKTLLTVDLQRQSFIYVTYLFEK